MEKEISIKINDLSLSNYISTLDAISRESSKQNPIFANVNLLERLLSQDLDLVYPRDLGSKLSKLGIASVSKLLEMYKNGFSATQISTLKKIIENGEVESAEQLQELSTSHFLYMKNLTRWEKGKRGTVPKIDLETLLEWVKEDVKGDAGFDLITMMIMDDVEKWEGKIREMFSDLVEEEGERSLYGMMRLLEVLETKAGQDVARLRGRAFLRTGPSVRGEGKAELDVPLKRSLELLKENYQNSERAKHDAFLDSILENKREMDRLKRVKSGEMSEDLESEESDEMENMESVKIEEFGEAEKPSRFIGFSLEDLRGVSLSIDLLFTIQEKQLLKQNYSSKDTEKVLHRKTQFLNLFSEYRYSELSSLRVDIMTKMFDVSSVLMGQRACADVLKIVAESYNWKSMMPACVVKVDEIMFNYFVVLRELIEKDSFENVDHNFDVGSQRLLKAKHDRNFVDDRFVELVNVERCELIRDRLKVKPRSELFSLISEMEECLEGMCRYQEIGDLIGEDISDVYIGQLGAYVEYLLRLTLFMVERRHLIEISPGQRQYFEEFRAGYFTLLVQITESDSQKLIELMHQIGVFMYPGEHELTFSPCERAEDKVYYHLSDEQYWNLGWRVVGKEGSGGKTKKKEIPVEEKRGDTLDGMLRDMVFGESGILENDEYLRIKIGYMLRSESV